MTTNPPPIHRTSVAIDLGAQSCRVSLLTWQHHTPEINIFHRFPNEPLQTNDGLRWDINKIYDGVIAGLQKCAAQSQERIASIAIDGWAVDYVRLRNIGTPIALPFCYRNPRTEVAEAEVHSLIPPSRLYELTGIQILRLNTLYQLYADKLAGYDPRSPWLNLPEFITYRLSGKRVSEFTNATHTGLVSAATKNWCDEIFSKLGLEISAAPEIVPSGTIVGPITADLASLPNFRDTKLIVPACHDTASAIAAIPASGDDWAFISSGTWSLVGTVLDSPCISSEAHAANFTNLGGVGRKTCFLKNVNGMWLLQQCVEEWESRGFRIDLHELLERCDSLPAPPSLINIDAPELILPGSMLEKINAQLAQIGRPQFGADQNSISSIANTIFHSMAARYAEVLVAIRKITGKKLRRLFIVGGGNQNLFLNRLTAQRTGLELILGSTESSTIGNFAVQLAALDPRRIPRSAITLESVAKWAEHLSATPRELQ